MNIALKTLSALSLAAAALAATVGSSNALTFRQPPGGYHCLACTTQPKPLPFHIPPGGFHCFVCTTESKTPPTKPGHGWGYGNGWGRGRPQIIVEGQPVAVGAVATGAVATGAVAARPAAGQVAAAGEPCNCLTKQNLPDGSVLFEDICTKQSAIGSPVTVGSR